MKKIILMVLVNTTLMLLSAQSTLITNIDGRNTTSLNGKWKIIVDPYETGFYDYRFMAFDQVANTDPAYGGFYIDRTPRSSTDRVEYSFDNSPSLIVPRDWNSQDEKLFYYEGTIWYRKKFDYVKKESSNRVFVHFGAANYMTDVYINGKKLGNHIGGFTAFNYEITDLLQEKNNSIVVKVDNKRYREAVPTLNTDWWNYGGITRDVNLVEVASTFVQDYQIQLKKGDANTIKGFVLLNGNSIPDQIKLDIPETKMSVNIKTEGKTNVAFEIPVKKLVYWSPENPKLYDVKISTGKEMIADKIGFRTLETKGTDILLNGKSVFLRGICIHEENPIRGGRAYSEEDARMLLGWAKELNCNFVRLAHYPHNENMVRIADEMGIMVWSEIPVYWTILWENPATLQNAKQQLTDMITRDRNRASVVIWSMANETPKSEARDNFLIELAKTARSLDSTRFISAAMEKEAKVNEPLTQIVEDPFAEYVDIISFNQYVGWYDGLPEKCNRVNWEIHYNKPVIISEFGGGALAGYHADSLTIWSEEFQENLYKQTTAMLDRIPQLRGVTPWILADFRSPKRLLPHIQDGWNRKGLISETGNKKKAFFVLKSFYQTKEQEYKGK